MKRKNIFTGIAMILSISLMTPLCLPSAMVNTVVSAETQELEASGTLPCENGETIQYTFENGVVTISGKGDKLVDPSPFKENKDITKVVFTDDCAIEELDETFYYCRNLSVVENIPDTVTSMEGAFRGTALTEVPELPSHLENLSNTFMDCKGITKVDFSRFPSSISKFDFAFSGTSVTDVTVVCPKLKDIYETVFLRWCFDECLQLKTVVIDATNVNEEAYINLQGICQGCSALESFELKNIPEQYKYPGGKGPASAFAGCKNLTSVKIEGYFDYGADMVFKNCKKLKTIDTKGSMDFGDVISLDKAFLNCEALEGTYYIQLNPFSEIYEGFYENKNLDKVKESCNYIFKGCSDKVTFYVGCKPLVDYCNSLKTQDEYKFDANVIYWKEGDTYQKFGSTTAPTGTPTPAGTEVPTSGAITTAPTATPKPNKTPTANSITNTTVSKVTVSASKKKVVLGWKKKANITGYQIYRKTGNGKYKLVKTIKKANVDKWTDKSVKSKKTYCYKIRAYKVKNKVKTYSRFSSVKKVKVK